MHRVSGDVHIPDVVRWMAQALLLGFIFDDLRTASRPMAAPNLSVAKATIQLVRIAKTTGITNMAVTIPIGASLCLNIARAMKGSGVRTRAIAGIQIRNGMVSPGARLRPDPGIGDLVQASHTATPTRTGASMPEDGAESILGCMTIMSEVAAMVTGIGDRRVINAVRIAGMANTSAHGLNACLGIARP